MRNTFISVECFEIISESILRLRLSHTRKEELWTLHNFTEETWVKKINLLILYEYYLTLMLDFIALKLT